MESSTSLSFFWTFVKPIFSEQFNRRRNQHFPRMGTFIIYNYVKDTNFANTNILLKFI